MVTQALTCRHCGSTDIIRFGFTQAGKPRLRCHACPRTFREDPGSNAHPEGFRARVLAAYQERPSMRGITRVFGV